MYQTFLDSMSSPFCLFYRVTPKSEFSGQPFYGHNWFPYPRQASMSSSVSPTSLKTFPCSFKSRSRGRKAAVLPIDFTDSGWVVEEWFSLCLSPGYLRSRINTAEIPLPYICTQTRSWSAALLRTVSAVTFQLLCSKI